MGGITQEEHNQTLRNVLRSVIDTFQRPDPSEFHVHQEFRPLLRSLIDYNVDANEFMGIKFFFHKEKGRMALEYQGVPVITILNFTK
jgi:hypothetical protein